MAMEVVEVILPGGDAEIRVASLDDVTQTLVFRQVSLGEDREVSVGGQAAVKLANIGSVTLQGDSVRLCSGGPGKTMLQLRFESTDRAQEWSYMLQKRCAASKTLPSVAEEDSEADSPVRAPGRTTAAPGDPPAAAGSAAHTAATLRLLVEQQEQQVKLLEAIQAKKGEQLLQLQEQLEKALLSLRDGQAAYSAQQRIFDEQQRRIEELRGIAEAADRVEAACARNAAQASAGWEAARKARAAAAAAEAEEEDDEEVEEEEEEEGGVPVGPGAREAARRELEETVEEKEELEAQLKQLRELHAMMQVLSLGGSLAENGEQDAEDDAE